MLKREEVRHSSLDRRRRDSERWPVRLRLGDGAWLVSTSERLSDSAGADRASRRNADPPPRAAVQVGR